LAPYWGTLQVAAVAQLGVPEPGWLVSMSQVMRFIAMPTGSVVSNSDAPGVEVLVALLDAAANCVPQTPGQPVVKARQVLLAIVAVAVLQRQGVPSSKPTPDSP